MHDKEESSSDIPKLFTVEELASYLKVSRGTVYYWTSRHEIPFVRAGRHLRFDLRAVLKHFHDTTEEKVKRR